jgi:hypothetical protein
MIEPDHPQLSIGQQCKLLSISRSSYYYEPRGETEQNLGLMRQPSSPAHVFGCAIMSPQPRSLVFGNLVSDEQ